MYWRYYWLCLCRCHGRSHSLGRLQLCARASPRLSRCRTHLPVLNLRVIRLDIRRKSVVRHGVLVPTEDLGLRKVMGLNISSRGALIPAEILIRTRPTSLEHHRWVTAF